MNRVAGNYGYLWVASEICYYLGLELVALFIPTLALILWMMSLVDKADPNYWYLLITWVLSALLFVVGVIIKNSIYSAEKIQKES
jgi:uncharacterized membrane protein